MRWGASVLPLLTSACLPQPAQGRARTWLPRTCKFPLVSAQSDRLPDAVDPSRTATQVVSFELDSRCYRIALDDEHAAQLRASVAPFVRKARVVSRAPRRALAPSGSRGKPARRDPIQAAAIRTWAISQGLLASRSARVTDQIAQAWEDAHRP